MFISSQFKRYCRQSRTDFSREQDTPEPERNSNSNSYNTATSSMSNCYNYSPAYFFLLSNGTVYFSPLYHISLECYSIVDHEETEPPAGPSGRPLLWLARQLEAIQSRIKAETEDGPRDSNEIPPISQAPSFKVTSRQPEAIQSQIKVDTQDSPLDSDEIPSISQARPPFLHQSRAARQGMIVEDISPTQTPRSKTVGPEYISDKSKRGRTEGTLNPDPEPEDDRVPSRVPLKKKPAMSPKQKGRSQSAPPRSSISGFSFNNCGSGTMINKDVGNAYNTVTYTTISDLADDRTRREKQTTDKFIYFLYLLAFCAFLIFLLSVIFLSCLYVLPSHWSYK